jgi:hypothetical protein
VKQAGSKALRTHRVQRRNHTSDLSRIEANHFNTCIFLKIEGEAQMNIPKVLPTLIAALALCYGTQAQAEGRHWATAATADQQGGESSTRSSPPARSASIQSPIDIRGAKAADLPEIHFDYKPSPSR